MPTYSRERFAAILKLALPIVLGMGSQNLVNIVDAAMVGRLGTVPLAAVGISSIFIWVTTSLIQGISPAVQAITARRIGEKRLDRQHEAIVNAIYSIIAAALPYSLLLMFLVPHVLPLLNSDPAVQEIGISYTTIRLFSVVFIGMNFSFRGYFNGRHMSTIYMKNLLFMHATNLALNYVLIFGNLGFPRLEADGAAYASAIATVLGWLNYVRMTWTTRTEGMTLHWRVVNRTILANIFKLALPSCINGLALSSGFLAFFAIAGMISTDALAATKVLIDLALICILFGMGFGLAVISLVGRAIGEQSEQEAWAWVKASSVLVTVFLGLIGTSYWLFPRAILGFFGMEAQVVEIAVLPLILLGSIQYYDGLTTILLHAHLGGGANKTVTKISIVTQWLIFLPTAFVWVRFFDGQLVHLWICMLGYRLINLVAFWVSARTGRWLRNQF